MDGVSDADHGRGAGDPTDEKASLAARFQIFLSSVSSTQPLYYDQTAASRDAAMPLYAVPNYPHYEFQQNDGTWTYAYYVSVAEAVPGALTRLLCGSSPCAATATVDASLFLSCADKDNSSGVLGGAGVWQAG